jgi:hypothetical protein
MSTRYSVGIDLGTTHTVVAYAEPESPTPRVFDIPQLVSASEVEALPLLPSALYAPLPGEIEESLLGRNAWLTGTHARRRGQEVPDRLVSSAKSWLSHAGVDRTAPILPWGVELEAPLQRLSPVDASHLILEHVRAAWDSAFPAHPLAEQSLVLTVPASFDEVARELTVRAAERTGLHVRLLEEPQAAFYDFMAQTGSAELERLLLADRERATALVCDVGGGTTDLTLIEVSRAAAGELELTRVAVGRHLLLGGDNIDLALAYRAEAALVTPPERLEPRRFNQLILACRAAKERLLAENAPEAVTISIAGSGASLVGATQSTTLTRRTVEEIVLDGFLPVVPRNATPRRGRAGLVAYGLPYEHDPAITRHVASFFARHSELASPDALLLNGGLFLARPAAARLRDVVGGWGNDRTLLLPQPAPELAVARGAVAFGLAVRGHGLRIGGGTPRGFYAVVDKHGERRALSIVPRGAREGERHLAEIRGLVLRVGTPVRFELLSSDRREVDAPGTVVAIDDDRFQALPPVTTVFDADAAADQREIAVALEGELSAVGTVDLACVELEPLRPPARRFRLAFDLRAAPPPAERVSVRAPSPALPPGFELAREAILRVFGKGRSDVKPRETKDLVRELERLLGERRSWPAELNRALFDVVGPLHPARRRSEDHERVFWMLAGYCLRPGTGHPLDPERMKLLAPLFSAGIVFAETRNWQQFFIAFRRIAAGLDESIQSELVAVLEPFVATEKPKLKLPKHFRPLATPELLELVSWLERVPVAARTRVGAHLIERTWSDREPGVWAALGRVGARIPAYASAHHVVPPSAAERYLDHLLRERWAEIPTATAAAAQMARMTGDRARDVSETLRRQVADRLEAAGAPEEWVRGVRELVSVEDSERADRFGDDLPPGLVLRADDD